MKQLLLICLCLTSILTSAQHISQKPDYEAIQALITSEGENNYDILLNRLQRHDTTLTAQHYYILYYGQSLQPEYMPYSLNNQFLFDLLKNKQQDEFITQAKVFLQEYPFDLRIRSYLIHQLYDQNETNIHVQILNGLIDALLLSGLGESQEDAIHVMSVSDEYTLLQSIGFHIASRRSQMPYDVFVLEDNKHGIKELYFDVSIPISSLNKRLEKP